MGLSCSAVLHVVDASRSSADSQSQSAGLCPPPSSELGPPRLVYVLHVVYVSPASPARSRCWPSPSPPPLCSPSRPPQRQPSQSTTTAAARVTRTRTTTPTTCTEPMGATT